MLVQALRAGGLQPATLTAQALVVSLLLNAVVMGLGSVAIVALLRPGRGAAARRLFLVGGWPPVRAVGVGVFVALVALLLYAGVLAALAQFFEFPRNRAVLDLGAQLTWPLVLFVAAASSLSEELYFRALLLPRIGLVASSVLFGLVHISYGEWLQVIVPGLIGVAFGLLLLRTRSVWAPVAGHFAWNFVQLAGAMALANGDASAALAVPWR